jgi:protein-tyrosine-phosphatase
MNHPDPRPTLLFACVHNSGRSVAAAALARHYAGGLIDVRDAGSKPSREVNPAVARALAAAGLVVRNHVPTLLDYDLVQTADVVITLGCNEACPAVPGKRVIDWPVADPKGQDDAGVARVLIDLDIRVRGLLRDLAPDLVLAAPVFSDGPL